MTAPNQFPPASAPAEASLADRLKTWPQHWLPQHGLSRCAHFVTRCRYRPFKDALIDWFIRRYRVDMSTALQPDPRRYESFNDFFTRALDAGARRWPARPDALACPVDGQVSQLGYLREEVLVQAKGQDYRLAELLAGDGTLAARFRDGAYATLYLSPRDYHRIHMPVAGRLTRMIYVPGRLFAVNAHTARVVPRLFARNERVISIFDTAVGPMALIMVGAIFVGSMETVWAGRITPARDRGIRQVDYPGPQPSLCFERGAEMGRFNMGSTVILLFGRDRIRWSPSLRAGGTLRLGMELGELR